MISIKFPEILMNIKKKGDHEPWSSENSHNFDEYCFTFFSETMNPPLESEASLSPEEVDHYRQSLDAGCNK